jgi:hypothetical protein
MTENAERPARVTHEHVRVGDIVPVLDSDVPYSYIAKHVAAVTEECCKNPANLTYHVEKTDPALPNPNKAVITCTECGRKHVRFAGASGQL